MVVDGMRLFKWLEDMGVGNGGGEEPIVQLETELLVRSVGRAWFSLVTGHFCVMVVAGSFLLVTGNIVDLVIVESVVTNAGDLAPVVR